MSAHTAFLSVIRAQQRRQALRLMAATIAGAATAASSVLLLGLSGWFIAGAAVAGLGGASAVMAFNYLLPSAAIRLFAIVRTGGRYAERLLGHSAAFKAMASFRAQVFRSLAIAPVEVSLGFSTGEASSRLVEDVDAIENQFVGLSAGPAAVVALAAGLGLTSLLGPAPTIVLLVGAAILTLGGRRLHQRLTDAAGARSQVAIGRLKDRYASFADAAPELICYDFTEPAIDLIMESDGALAVARNEAARGSAAVAALQALCMAGTAVGVILTAGRAPVALIAMGALGAAAALDGVSGLLRAFERRGAYLSAVARLSEVSTAGESSPSGPFESPPDICITVDGHVTSARVGDRLAICGASGSGKTRLLDEMIKLRPTSDASITIASTAVARLSSGAARGLFSYIPQNAPVLTGSIQENLRLGKPDATDLEMWGALRAAALDARVAAMPNGLMTWTGQGGERLSGGERRRLCLARALLRPAPWLVLDEPTEGLDLETEQQVVANICEHLDRTGQGLILVSHRTHPLRLCSIRLEVDP